MQSKSQMRSSGIDLGETTFHLVALGTSFSGSNSQEAFTSTTAGVPGQFAFMVDRDGGRSGVAVSGTSPARTGTSGRLIPAQFVRPFVKG
jgi:transposase